MQRRGVWRWGYVASVFPGGYFGNITQLLPRDVTIFSVTIASESHTFVNWNLKKKKSTFKLMHPFPELHKEGIK